MSADQFFQKLHARYSQEAQHLNALDAAIGDGDHGTTMLRGLTRALRAAPGARAKAFMRASGGASGTLFGLILLEIETHLDKGTPLNLARACDRICDLGDVQRGDKSMVDSLAPAVGTQAEGTPAMVVAAAAGRNATVDMQAKRGRAQYVENHGKGHLDPGAASVVIILETLGEVTP